MSAEEEAVSSIEVPANPSPGPKFDRSKMPDRPPESMEDFARMPPEIQTHLQRIATPAHVAMTVTADAPESVRWSPAKHLMHMNEKITTSCLTPDQTFLDMEVSVRHGKSYLCSGYAPFWYMGWFPERRVILLSYNEDRAATWGEFVRELMALWGPELFGLSVDRNASSKKLWKIAGHRGELIATGLSGTITGVGGDLVVIDDPIKNRKDADSATERKDLLEGYASNVRTRLQGEGTVVLAMARWREDDLAGAIVHGHGQDLGDLDLDDDEPDEWEVVNLPAVAEAPDPPEEVKDKARWRRRWRDEIGRKDGEPLWPEEWPLRRLRRIRATLMRSDPQAWDSLYQQRPTGKGGNRFKTAQWNITESAPQGLRKVRWWDIAASKDAGDWTVGALIGMDAEGAMFIIDVQRKRLDTAEVEALVKQVARIDGKAVPIRMEQEKAGAGKAQSSVYARKLIGYDFEGIPPVGDKEARATGYVGHQQRGNCWLVKGDWNAQWIEEHRLFPKSENDDQVDCGSGGFDFLADQGPTVMETQHQTDTPLAALLQGRALPNAVGRGVLEARRAALPGRRR